MRLPDSRTVYLRSDTKCELLVGRWYAWQHLLTPVQRALNVQYRQLPMLKSFIANPSVHVAASKDPALLGGSFMELSDSEIDRARELLRTTEERCLPLMSLAKDIKKLDADLAVAAKGLNLDAVYSGLPPSLAGLIELAYDEKNRYTIRVREFLAQSDPRYACNFHELLLHRVPDDGRRFFLNTPRVVEDQDRMFLDVPFADEWIDRLARSRTHGEGLQDLVSAHVGSEERSRFVQFFAEQPPVRNNPSFDGTGVRVRYFGHACVLLQTRETSILIDPRFAFDRNTNLATLTFSDLPDFIDVVAISHGHQDHFCAETLVQLRHKVGQVVVPRNSPGSLVDPSMKLALRNLGFVDVRVMDDLDSITFKDGELISLPFPGEHCGLDISSKHCVAVRLKGRSFVFLVDSDAADIALYDRISKVVSNVDALFIGMECRGAPLTWLYGPLLMARVTHKEDESRRGNGSNFERAWNVVQRIGCSSVYVYAMGMEPWNRHLLGLEYDSNSMQIVESDKLVAACRSAGIESERLQGCREFVFSDAEQGRSGDAKTPRSLRAETT